MGGMDRDEHVLSSAHKFNPVTKTWKSIARMNDARVDAGKIINTY